jgi:hypothetical protein
MSLKPNPKEINIVLNNLKGAQFEFFSRAPFYIDTPQVARGRVDPVPDPLLLRKSGRAGNRTWDLWMCSQKL